MDCAKLVNTVVVGDDMDLLVLLCYRTDKHSKYLLSTEAQSKLYQVQGLGHKQNQRWTWQQCWSSEPSLSMPPWL